MKTCRQCKVTLPFSSFCKNRRSPDGVQTICRGCMKQYRKENSAKIAKQRNSIESKNSRLYRGLMRQYGLSASDFDTIKEAQGGKCAVCNAEGKRLVVDHCHHTGVVRGLVCYGCNIDIRILEGPTEKLAAAKKYLEKSYHQIIHPSHGKQIDSRKYTESKP